MERLWRSVALFAVTSRCALALPARGHVIAGLPIINELVHNASNLIETDATDPCSSSMSSVRQSTKQDTPQAVGRGRALSSAKQSKQKPDSPSSVKIVPKRERLMAPHQQFLTNPVRVPRTDVWHDDKFMTLRAMPYNNGGRLVDGFCLIFKRTNLSIGRHFAPVRSF